MKLTFLGTGAGSPTRSRNVTSSVLNLQAEHGTTWMFDCGEGTQHRIISSPYRLGHIDKLFVTHLHGDHIFGIPGFLTSRSFKDGDQPFTVYGPRGIREYLETSIRLSRSRIGYELRIEEIGEGTVLEDDRFLVEAGRVDHRIECFGYRITEKDLPGTLRVDLLKEAGVFPGPIFARLKRGETVTLDDGTMLDGRRFVGEPIRGRVVAIIGDTRYYPGTLKLARDADLLVHEATFAYDLSHLAEAYGHCTAVSAARIAKEAKARMLVMTHISARYQKMEDALLEEARAIFPESHVAEDYLSIDIPRQGPLTREDFGNPRGT